MNCKFDAIIEDCNANGINGRSWKTLFQGLWFSPAVRILLSHRIQYRLKQKGGAWRTGLARFLYLRSLNKWGCDIGNQAEISPGLHMPHPVGIVIGNFVKIEKDCAIYQGVTLGDALGKSPGRPTIRQGSTVYAHAIVLGDIEVSGTVKAQELVRPKPTAKKRTTAKA